MAIRAEFCKNETVNPNISFRNNAPAELCYRDVHDNSHHCLGTMFIVWIHVMTLGTTRMILTVQIITPLILQKNSYKNNYAFISSNKIIKANCSIARNNIHVIFM